MDLTPVRFEAITSAVSATWIEVHHDEESPNETTYHQVSAHCRLRRCDDGRRTPEESGLLLGLLPTCLLCAARVLLSTGSLLPAVLLPVRPVMQPLRWASMWNFTVRSWWLRRLIPCPGDIVRRTQLVRSLQNGSAAYREPSSAGSGRATPLGPIGRLAAASGSHATGDSADGHLPSDSCSQSVPFELGLDAGFRGEDGFEILERIRHKCSRFWRRRDDIQRPRVVR